LKEIYANRKANVQKTAWYKILDAGTGAMSTHSEVNRERHAFRRRVLDHAFSDNAIRSAETFIIENIRNWCKHLGKGARHGEWTSAKNMSDWCTYVAYDIMGDLVFGKRFDIMESDEHRFVPPMSMSASQFIYTVTTSSPLSRKGNPINSMTDNTNPSGSLHSPPYHNARHPVQPTNALPRWPDGP
jgi:cytochrome P450